MAEIPVEDSLSTVAAIMAKREEKQGDGFREHLGASLIGEPCLRKLWYLFRWSKKQRHSGRMLRLFETGQLEESRLVEDLRSIGIEVHEVDQVTGEQFRVSHLGGHFGGSMDGCALGLVEAPKTWHVLEFKTHNDKSFEELKKKGVALAKPLHFAQMQIYMGLTGMDRAYYLAKNKNTDELYEERIRYNKKYFEELMIKAQQVVYSQYPLAKLSESPTDWRCRFCDMAKICHEKAMPEINCRTCLHSTPKPDGTWACEKFHKILSAQEQRDGCGSHLFIPTFIGKPVDSGHGYVEYEHGVRNLEGGAVV